jgi:hypothetical protein
MDIVDYFTQAQTEPSDIVQHIETLYRYSLRCNHITEMGVRGVVSSWAFLIARPKKLISYDINQCPVDELSKCAKEINVEFEFKIADTGHPDTVIENTDLLFIDTWHIYAQLKQELSLHSPKVNKYIIMHDTASFGFTGVEAENYEGYVKRDPDNRGLWPAIEEFLEDNPNWILKERFYNCNGLTILEKIK